MNYAEHIARLEATRKEKAARMAAIQQKAMDDGRTKDTAEAEEFEALKAEIKGIDTDLVDVRALKAIEDADAATAQPVDDSSKRRAPASTKGVQTLQVRDTTKVDKGIGFARFARVKALAHLGLVNGLRSEPEVAKAVYPGDDALIGAVTKGSVPAASSLNSTWAGALVLDGGAVFADFVEYLRPRSLLAQISGRLRQLPFDTKVLIQSSGGYGKWVKEGFAKPLTNWSYTTTRLAPLKAAAIAAATKESLMRASVAADTLLRDELARTVNARVDGTLFSDDAAVSDEAPAGLLNGTTPVAMSAGTSIADIRCDIATLINELVGNNLSVSGAFWVMPETVAVHLSLICNEVGNSAFPGIGPTGGTLAGLPVYTTQFAEESTDGQVVALIKGDEVFLADEGGIQVSMSDQASLVMDDNSALQNSTTPTGSSVVSLWQTNSVAFLVERFVNWSKRRSAALAWGRVNWSACTVS